MASLEFFTVVWEFIIIWVGLDWWEVQRLVVLWRVEGLVQLWWAKIEAEGFLSWRFWNLWRRQSGGEGFPLRAV